LLETAGLPMLRKAMAKPILVQWKAQRRHDLFGGGELPSRMPNELRGHLPKKTWDELYETMNKELRAENKLRLKSGNNNGVPTMLTIACLCGAAMSMIIMNFVHVDLDLGPAFLMVVPVIMVSFWLFMLVLLRKHSKKISRDLNSIEGRMREACKQITDDNRCLIVKLKMGMKDVDVKDWRGRPVVQKKDMFQIDILVVPEDDLPPITARSSGSHGSKSSGSTRPPSTDSSDHSESALRESAKAEYPEAPEPASSSPSKPKQVPPPSQRCPAGHLLEKDDGEEWNCDGCSKSMKPGSFVYMCQKCDYGLCFRCLRKQVGEAEERGASTRDRPASNPSATSSLHSSLRGTKEAWT